MGEMYKGQEYMLIAVNPSRIDKNHKNILVGRLNKCKVIFEEEREQQDYTMTYYFFDNIEEYVLSHFTAEQKLKLINRLSESIKEDFEDLQNESYDG